MKKIALLLLIAMLAVSFTACKSGTIYVKHEDYSPQASATEGYKDVEVWLSDFTNNADNTTMWYFYAPDRSMTYETWPSVNSFLWYCFQKAFVEAGFVVHPDSAPSNVPAVSVVFTSFSDREIEFQVTVVRQGNVLAVKEFDVTYPLPEVGTDEAALIKRVYEFVDKMAQTVLADPEFKQAILSR
jgi:hypothetical protein